MTTAPDSLGPLLGADDIRDAVTATILEWSPYYLGVLSLRLQEAGRLGGKSQPKAPLPPFGKWRNQPTQRPPGTGIAPAFIVTSPATVGMPLQQGTGMVGAVWRAQVTIQVFGTTWQTAADLTSWYEKAVRWSLLQHRGLGGLAQNTKWMGCQYTGKRHSSTRTEGRVIAAYDVMVNDVVDVFAGPPAVPSTSGPPAPDPTVEDVIVDLTRVPITEDL